MSILIIVGFFSLSLHILFSLIEIITQNRSLLDTHTHTLRILKTGEILNNMACDREEN